MPIVRAADKAVMARALAGALLAFFMLAASATTASAADTIVGSGTTAWGTQFTLGVSQQRTPEGPVRCLGYTDADGAGAGCPLRRPPVDSIEAQTDVSCERKHVAIYGALDARVARVVVRLVGGQTLAGTRFDPAPTVDPQIAYWIVTFKGFTAVRSITALAADGSVLARERDAVGRYCEDEDIHRGRRYQVGVLSDPGGSAWRLNGYRALVRDDGRLIRTLCFEVRQVQDQDPLNEAVSATCGLGVEREAKALAVVGDGLGCRAGSNLILYGLARAEVGRIVLRSRAGWTVAVPMAGPPGLRAPARVWSALVRWPRSGIVIDAQDRRGRTIAKERVKPPRIPGAGPCPSSSFFGPL